MALLFNDTFTTTTTVDLDAHTPETGTSWTAYAANSSDIDIAAADDYASEVSGGTGHRYNATDDLGTTEYDVQADFAIVTSDTNLAPGLVARNTSATAVGAQEFVYDTGVSGGSYTCGADTVTEAWGTSYGTFATMKIEVRAGTTYCYKGGVLKITNTENPNPSTGKWAGICLINFSGAGGRLRVDNFSINSTGGGSPQSVTAQVASLSLAGIAGTRTPGNVTQTAQVGALTLAGSAGTATFGNVTQSAQPAMIALAGIAGVPSTGGGSPQSVTAQVASLTLAGIAGVLLPGAVTKTAQVATLTLSAIQGAASGPTINGYITLAIKASKVVLS